MNGYYPLYTIPTAIFITSTIFSIEEASMLLLFRFKSKGMTVFLTEAKGHASLEKNLHPLGSIFSQNLVPPKH